MYIHKYYMHTCTYIYMHTSPHTHTLTDTQTYTHIHTERHRDRQTGRHTHKLNHLSFSCPIILTHVQMNTHTVHLYKIYTKGQ